MGVVDISSAKVKSIIVHRIGNKFRSEGCVFSTANAAVDDEIKNIMLGRYLAPMVKSGVVHEFFHESDLSLNVVNHYAETIFIKNSEFVEGSTCIAKHLYGVSVHQNIIAGELIIVLFDDIRTELGCEQAIGLYKVEGRSKFLDTIDRGGVIQLGTKSGVSTDKIQKGALVLSRTKKIFVVDSTSNKTMYWVDNFLKILAKNSSKVCSNVARDFIKAVATECNTIDDIHLFGSDINTESALSGELSIGKIRSIAASRIGLDSANRILENVCHKNGHDVCEEFVLDESKLRKFVGDVSSSFSVVDGVTITVADRRKIVKGINVTETGSAIRIVIDLEVVV